MADYRKTKMIHPDADVHSAKNPCSCCGRKMAEANRRYFVHMIDGGSNVLHPDDYEAYMADEAVNKSGEMGLHPVGNTCAKKKFGAFAALIDTDTWTRVK
jgi:hypothetical protein